MPAQYWEAPLSLPTTLAQAGTALANSITLTDISPVPQATTVAGQLYSGALIRVVAFGVFSTTATPTLRIGAYYGGQGGVSLADTGAITTGTTLTNVPWRLEVGTHIRTVGTAGTAMSQGFCLFGTAVGTASFLPVPNTALATVTVDTTVAKTITVAAQWGTASASNTITCHGCIVELIG